MNHSLMLRVLVSGTLFVFFLSGASADDDERFENSLRRYRESLKRPSLRKRMKGREKFAATRHPKALKTLASSYAKPEKPKDRVRYLIASTCAQYFDQKEHVPTYREWRAKHRKASDAWLWFHALRVECWRSGLTAVLETAALEKNTWLRSAAYQALRHYDEGPILHLVPTWIDSLSAQTFERGIGLQAIAAVLLAQKRHRHNESFEPAVRQVVEQLDDTKLPKRYKLVVARHLASLLDTEHVLGLNAEPWLVHLKASSGKKGTLDDRYAPEFIGIRANGDRICYVIDASDSMLTPLSQRQRDDLRRPTTGAGSGPPELPWDKIETRFDVAREFLKLSLNKLRPEKRFAVILFGDGASLLASTRGLVQATPKRIAKAVDELDAISAGPAKKDRPYGTLRGKTNLHGGLDRAFRVKSKGLRKSDGYVSERMLNEGCDTIFLLSDGAPTWDDYAEWDEPDHGDEGGDPETGTKSGRDSSRLHFYGPYVWPPISVAKDVRRMNLFRAVEIHCIGIGEANMNLLQHLARAGLGRCVQIGGDSQQK